jgi:hypothetical protein
MTSYLKDPKNSSQKTLRSHKHVKHSTRIQNLILKNL